MLKTGLFGDLTARAGFSSHDFKLLVCGYCARRIIFLGVVARAYFTKSSLVRWT